MGDEEPNSLIERLLDRCEEALKRSDWETVRSLATDVLQIEPNNIDALAFLAAADPAASPTLPVPTMNGGSVDGASSVGGRRPGTGRATERAIEADREERDPRSGLLN